MPLAPGTRLGPHEIVELLGAGGMGEVYRARDTRLDRLVALKVLHGHLAADEHLRQRFDREARTISQLSHPNICALFDVGHQDGIDYLVSSANKCIEGVPVFAFTLARREPFLAAEGAARSLSLDLHAQWRGLETDGQFRFTPPTHSILAFHRALTELAEEGGIEARGARYRAIQTTLDDGMRKMGFQPYLPTELRGQTRYPSVSLLDLRVAKTFKIGSKANLEAMLNVYNVFNSATTINQVTTVGAAFGTPQQIMTPVIVGLGARLTF